MLRAFTGAAIAVFPRVATSEAAAAIARVVEKLRLVIVTVMIWIPYMGWWMAGIFLSHWTRFGDIDPAGVSPMSALQRRLFELTAASFVVEG
jgi:hypothetical protein